MAKSYRKRSNEMSKDVLGICPKLLHKIQRLAATSNVESEGRGRRDHNDFFPTTNCLFNVSPMSLVSPLNTARDYSGLGRANDF